MEVHKSYIKLIWPLNPVKIYSYIHTNRLPLKDKDHLVTELINLFKYKQETDFLRFSCFFGVFLVIFFVNGL